MPLGELIKELRKIINQNIRVDKIEVIDGYPYIYVKGGNCIGSPKNKEEEDRQE